MNKLAEINLDDGVFKEARMVNRPTILGTKHMTSAGHYTAAHVGFEIMEAGGNAIDAGVGAGIAVNVVQSYCTNFGGVAPIMIYIAKTREVHTIDGIGGWPKAMTPDLFQKQHGGAMPSGVLRCVMPASADAWMTALERFGTMTFAEVATPAIRLARDGFPMYPLMSDFIKSKQAGLSRWPSNKKMYLPKGRAPEVAEVFVQADLGKLLQHLADVEKSNRRKGRKAAIRAARDEFYKGDIAAAIARFHKQNGGLVTREDLAAYSVKFEPSVKAKFKGVELHACGPWSQGPTLPLALNIVKGYDLRAMGHNSPEYIHVVNEALKLAFADRHYHIGDPAFAEVPLKGLMSDAYAAFRRGMIKKDRAWSEMPPAGDPATLTELEQRFVPPSQPDTDVPGGDTTHICCVDEKGNAFGVTTSDSCNGSPIIPGLGIVCSHRGNQSWVQPDHPNSVGPGKRPRLTPNPAMVLKNGKLQMAFGTPGGDVQPQTMLQVFLNMQVFGMDVQQAIEAPRFAGYSYPGSVTPNEYFPARLCLESRIPAQTGDVLTRFGHKIHWWGDWNWLAGAPCAVVRDPKTGVLQGGADSRRPAYAVGW